MCSWTVPMLCLTFAMPQSSRMRCLVCRTVRLTRAARSRDTTGAREHGARASGPRASGAAGGYTAPRTWPPHKQKPLADYPDARIIPGWRAPRKAAIPLPSRNVSGLKRAEQPRRRGAACAEARTGRAANDYRLFGEAPINTGAPLRQRIRLSSLRAGGPGPRATPSTQKGNELGAVRIDSMTSAE